MTVKLNKLYTKSGDKGQTHLVGGKSVSKASQRVNSYGTVDELNATIAAVVSEDFQNLFSKTFLNIQQELFDLGAYLAYPEDTTPILPIDQSIITRLENQIDKELDGIAELKSFVIPGGSKLNVALHLARTVCRRAEREVCLLAEQEKVAPEIIIYLNRLSDLLFACCRRESDFAQREEVLWVPKNKRNY
jgi:cob(I)alamin adenosyltransferase